MNTSLSESVGVIAEYAPVPLLIACQSNSRPEGLKLFNNVGNRYCNFGLNMCQCNPILYNPIIGINHFYYETSQPPTLIKKWPGELWGRD